MPSASPTAAPDAAVAAGSPGGDWPPSRRPGELLHSWFWSNYPKRVNAMEADLLLDDLLAQGVSREAIEAGAAHYAAHIRRNHWADKYVSAPLAWLQKKKWVDRYAEPEQPAVAQRQAAAAGKPAAKGSKPAQDARSGSGKGKGAAKPAAAAKAPETPEERSARLRAAAEKRAIREAERAAADKKKAEALNASIEKAVDARARFLAVMEEAGIPREKIANLAAKTLQVHGAIEAQYRSYKADSIDLAIRHDLGRNDEWSRGPFIGWFSEPGHLPGWANRIVKQFKDSEELRRSQAAAAQPALQQGGTPAGG